jgi:hypothetical protein
MCGDEKGRAIELYSMRYSLRVSFTPSSRDQPLSPYHLTASPHLQYRGTRKLLSTNFRHEIRCVNIVT